MGKKNRKLHDSTLKRKAPLDGDDAETISHLTPRTKRKIVESNGHANEAYGITNTKLTLLPTRHNVARWMIQLLSSDVRQLVLVEGPIGSGKSHIAAFVAQEMNLPLHSMQMGDQIDSKSLYGSYICTEVPGEFQWKPSDLANHLNTPCVVLFEDLHTATDDVISDIIELARTRILVSSGLNETTTIHNQAHIIATISTKCRNYLLESLPIRYLLNDFTDAELRRLVADIYPRVAHISKSICSIFRQLGKVPATSNSRRLTSTDLLRGAGRLNGIKDLSDNYAVFTEIVDAWCLADTDALSTLLLKKVAAAFSITEDQLHTHMNVRQPTFSHDDFSVKIGRVQLERKCSLLAPQKHRLGQTRDVLQLLERVARCVQLKEPALLVGETGVGKTSVVQALASSMNVTLNVVNLTPNSDADELVQGYRPTSVSENLQKFFDFYLSVFDKYKGIDGNAAFIDKLKTCANQGRYVDFLTVVEKTTNRLLTSDKRNMEWAEVLVRARRIREGITKGAAQFGLMRGAVLDAVRQGHWLLIDEINLASPECLDAIVHAIRSDAHPDFRLFACMNPATDSGKRRLPQGVRARFTEFFVSEMVDPHQLALVVSAYLPAMKTATNQKLVNFYLVAKKQFPGCYSLRTLCRALLFTSDNMFGNEDRSLYEAISMAFLTNLDTTDKAKMSALINKSFLVPTNIAVELRSGKPEDYVKIAHYFVQKGTVQPAENPLYVLTKSVTVNISEISRIVSSGRFPVLLEGETSAGKTSIVCHLARITGNEVVRINNHEHTDVQEYFGSYVATETGHLEYREGALVRAVRNGHWVILDELNLAPTDVIEALNRLLDDNRELFVPESKEVVHAHPQFRLFATQNPAGRYAGRKRLSRALLSRFIVLKFNPLPLDELSQMICTRCSIHTSAAQKMIQVLEKLRMARSLSGMFSSKDGLMTLRDVFRWAKRLSTDDTCEDWLQVLANHGFFLLAGRCRNVNDEGTVLDTLQDVLKRKIDRDSLFSLDSPYLPPGIETKGIVLTKGMRRMLVLTYQAWLRSEAVLLVGETGGGKTSLCEMMGRGNLATINCHERTETADFLGRLRPDSHGKGFVWEDGIVVKAMENGLPLLIDEISLAEDSVLERLNPLFEEERSLLLSDAGSDVRLVTAKDSFQLIATMNPGGDYGKKELSKALRNRFTEVWSTNEYDRDELVDIFDTRWKAFMNNSEMDSIKSVAGFSPGQVLVRWIARFYEGRYQHFFRQRPSIRDLVACSELYSALIKSGTFDCAVALGETVHGVFLDALATLRGNLDHKMLRTEAINILRSELKDETGKLDQCDSFPIELANEAAFFGCGDRRLSLDYGPKGKCDSVAFDTKAHTCQLNFYRIVRGLLMTKPILLEGPPGCGKSSTVLALAKMTGNEITRINLSDQTDLTDLFGTDMPTTDEDGQLSFKWVDGPVLRAIKEGRWVLLDEMNLASQSVLEGLNACFDYRRELYIPELGRSFTIPEGGSIRFFACQNPTSQGGNRRSLPKSFVNRFTTIYIDDLHKDDMESILRGFATQRGLDENDENIGKVVNLSMKLSTMSLPASGSVAFNLRDLLRWLLGYSNGQILNAAVTYELLFVARARVEKERRMLREVFRNYFGTPCGVPAIVPALNEHHMTFGEISLPRISSSTSTANELCLLPCQNPVLYFLAKCISMCWMVLLVGERNCGKRSVVETIAGMCGIRLESLSLTSATDASELIGSYKQVIDAEPLRETKEALAEVLSSLLLGKAEKKVIKQMRAVETFPEVETCAELLFSKLGEDEQSVILKCRAALTRVSRNAMKFVWVDSKFVRAYTEGHWIIVNDVNACSAAVLDRLNCALEEDGELYATESGKFVPLQRHENFRIFMTMDHRNGEISRAMRNRSVEIFMDESCHWHRSEYDLAMLIGRSLTIKQNVSSNRVAQVAHELSLQPAQTSRQLLTYLKAGLPFDDVTRIVGIEDAEAMDTDDGSFSVNHLPPTVQELSHGAEHRLNCYLSHGWSMSGLDGLLWAMLGGAKNWILSQPFKDAFAEATVFLNLPVVEELELSTSSADLRLSMEVSQKAMDVAKNDKYASAVLRVWLRRILKSTPVEESSLQQWAEKVAGVNCSLNVEDVLSARVMIQTAKKAFQTFDKEGIVDPQQLVIFGLLYVHVMTSFRRTVCDRKGIAPLFIAWNRLKQIEKGSMTNAIAELSEFEQTCVARHEDFVNNFLPLYEARLVAAPFADEQTFKDFLKAIENVAEEVEDSTMKGDHNDDTPTMADVRTLTGRLSAALRALLREEHGLVASALQGQDGSLTRELQQIALIPWTEKALDAGVDERWRRLCTLLSTVGKDNGDQMHLVPTRGLSWRVLDSWWRMANFDPRLSQLSVADARGCDVGAFWRLVFDSVPIVKSLDKKMRELLQHYCKTEDSLSIIEAGIKLMKEAAPPIHSLDPVTYRESEGDFITKVTEMIERPLDVLRRVYVTFTGMSDEWNQGEWAAHLSGHPVVISMLRMRAEFDELRKSRVDIVCYRQLAQQYSSLLVGMHGLLAAAGSICEAIEQNSGSDVRAVDLNAVKLTHDKLISFVRSLVNFRTSVLQRYGSFVDVVVPFLEGVAVVQLGVERASDKLAALWNRKELQTTTAFPIMIQTKRCAWGVFSPEIDAWAVRDTSPLPLALKTALVGWRLETRREPHTDLHWMRAQWQKWYENSVAKSKEKDFIYRSKNEEEKEEAEIEQFFSQVERDTSVINEGDIPELLKSIVNKENESIWQLPGQKWRERVWLADVWLRRLLVDAGVLKASAGEPETSYMDLLCLWEVQKNQVGVASDCDVYGETSHSEIVRACELIDKLEEHVIIVQEQWPEIAALRLTREAISAVREASIGTPMAKMADLLEKIIEEADEWEKLAAQHVSLSEELDALKGLLIDWKKIEMKSWGTLLRRQHEVVRKRTLTVAFPLFNSLFNAEGAESETTIVPMAIEWISNSTLFEYSAKIDSVLFLAEWARLLRKDEVCQRLLSVVAHFRQFGDIIATKAKDMGSPHEQTLKDYMDIVKFNDLNLQSIRASTQKVHAHLYKIVRKYKEALGIVVTGQLDEFPSIETVKSPQDVVSEIVAFVPEDDARAGTKVAVAKNISTNTLQKAVELMEVGVLTDFAEQVNGCKADLSTDINYDKYTEDEEKEKAQGYARNSRQREVAMIIKRAQELGLNARRAATLKQEKLTEDAVTGIEVGAPQEVAVRICVAGRNACIRKSLAKSEQLGVATRKHLSGVVEYGLWWMLRSQERVAAWHRVVERLGVVLADLQVLATSEESRRRDHCNVLELTVDLSQAVEEMSHLATRVQFRAKHATRDSESGLLDASNTLVVYMERMSSLTVTSHGKVLTESFFSETIPELKRLCCEVSQTSNALSAFHDVSRVKELVQVVGSLCEKMLSARHFEINNYEEDSYPAKRVQENLYKGIAEKSPLTTSGATTSEEIRCIDRFNGFMDVVDKSCIEKGADWLESALESCLAARVPSHLTAVVAHGELMRDTLKVLCDLGSRAIYHMAVLYAAMIGMSIQLFDKGYVNSIPKAGKQEAGNKETDEPGEGGGMGEGSAGGQARDVTDEMEETGQIEGLQGEEPEEPQGQQGSNETPIDVDDDFAEDLQDIDRNEPGCGDDDKSDEEEEEEEPEAEDQKGEVDDEDEKQLDPKLWDEEEKDEQQEQKDIDQENQAADEKTKELAAKEDETAAAEDKEVADDTPAEEDNEKDDTENVDERDQEGQAEELPDQKSIEEADKDDLMPEEGKIEEGDATDDEDEERNDEEEEDTKGDADENMDVDEVVDEQEEENREDELRNENPGEEKEEQPDSMEQGIGGEEAKDDDMTGGRDAEDDEQTPETEKQEKGKSASDVNGEQGNGTEAKKKEERDKNNDEEAMEDDNNEEKPRELADEDEENKEEEEDKERGEGDADEHGTRVEDSKGAEREMLDAGSLEEAKESKKDRQDKNDPSTQRKKPRIAADEADGVVDVHDDMAPEEIPAAIHLAADNMMTLAEDLTKELVFADFGLDDNPKQQPGLSGAGCWTREEASKLWEAMKGSVDLLSAELAENLRLILEPQRASRMQGDYKSGKRLNMRRLIAFIASEYRKDRIWMRRTKRAQRDYQVLIAVDDSASMNENGVRQVTCESVLVIDDALRRCDAGAVSVCSFGSQVETVVAFGDQMPPGDELLQQFSFGQSSTDLVGLLQSARVQLDTARTPSSEQLLIIISDGMGVLNQGEIKVREAIAALHGVTVLFVVLDCCKGPGGRSVTQHTVVKFIGDKMEMVPYLSKFPFPFFCLVNRVAQVPSVLAESIRQWFEMVQSEM